MDKLSPIPSTKQPQSVGNLVARPSSSNAGNPTKLPSKNTCLYSCLMEFLASPFASNWGPAVGVPLMGIRHHLFLELLPKPTSCCCCPQAADSDWGPLVRQCRPDCVGPVLGLFGWAMGNESPLLILPPPPPLTRLHPNAQLPQVHLLLWHVHKVFRRKDSFRWLNRFVDNVTPGEEESLLLLSNATFGQREHQKQQQWQEGRRRHSCWPGKEGKRIGLANWRRTARWPSDRRKGKKDGRAQPWGRGHNCIGRRLF